MFKNLVVFATACVCLAAAHKQVDVHTADKTFLTKQKEIWSLFWHIDQPTTVNSELYQVARSFSIEDHVDAYTNASYVHHFMDLYKHGLIHRDAVFSMFHPEHHHEAVALFKLFFHAKDWETFYNTAVWARFNVNPKLFGYVLAVAVIHRPDTKYMTLPPLYEIMPHYFFNNEVMQAAYHVKMGDASVKKAIGVKYHEGSDVVIHSNYSGWYMIHDDAEDELNYFTEDIGLNSYYFYFIHEFPHFMSSEHYHMLKEIRGEVYFFGHKQLLARYYLERLSHDMGEIESIDWHEPIVTGYYPTMNHPNGLPFPHRHSWTHVPHHKFDLVHDAEQLETRILGAIDSGVFYDASHPPKGVKVYTPEGFNTLGNLIQGNADSIHSKFYGSIDHIYRQILGFGLKPIDKNHLVPSALEYSITSMRDPAFYRMYKKIVNYFLKFKEHLPHYTHEELAFPGVKIESVAVDKLLTFFEHYDSIVSNGMPVSSQKDAETTVIKVRQHRLNHKPFTSHITVSSDKNVKAVIRMFYGPKYDVHGHEIDFVDNWVNFIELDQWVVDLKSGINKIERSSHESIYVIPDEVNSATYWKHMIKSMESDEPMTYSSQLYGFPDRLVLPKGKKDGFPIKMFVYVSEYDESHAFKHESPIWGSMMTDGKPLSYPLDRPVVPYEFDVPNAHFKDVVVYHKHVEELNLTI